APSRLELGAHEAPCALVSVAAPEELRVKSAVREAPLTSSSSGMAPTGAAPVVMAPPSMVAPSISSSISSSVSHRGRPAMNPLAAEPSERSPTLLPVGEAAFHEPTRSGPASFFFSSIAKPPLGHFTGVLRRACLHARCPNHRLGKPRHSMWNAISGSVGGSQWGAALARTNARLPPRKRLPGLAARDTRRRSHGV